MSVDSFKYYIFKFHFTLKALKFQTTWCFKIVFSTLNSHTLILKLKSTFFFFY